MGGHAKQQTGIGAFIRRYIFSVDHKVIGVQYGITALCFMFLGLVLMLMMRWQLAYPGADDPAIPFFGKLLKNALPGGKLTPELYNSFGAMHGTIMVFLGVVPLAVGAHRLADRGLCRTALLPVRTCRA